MEPLVQAGSTYNWREWTPLTDIIAAEVVNQRGEILVVAERCELTGSLIASVGDSLVNASKQQYPSTVLLHRQVNKQLLRFIIPDESLITKLTSISTRTSVYFRHSGPWSK